MLSPTVTPPVPEAPPWPLLSSLRVKEELIGKEKHGIDGRIAYGDDLGRDDDEHTGMRNPCKDADYWLQPREPSAPGWGLMESDLVYEEERLPDKCGDEWKPCAGPDAPVMAFVKEGSRVEDDHVSNGWIAHADRAIKKLKDMQDSFDEMRQMLEMMRKDLKSKVGVLVPSDDIGLLPEHAESPPTRSPVTYVGLLPAVRDERIAEHKMRQIVVVLEAPRLSMQGVTLAVDDEFVQLAGTLPVASAKTRKESGARVTLAGTDVLGYRLPPDGCDGYNGPAGTDVRCLCLPPDSVPVRLLPEERETMRVTCAGTDERRFRRPPNPRGVDLREGVMGFECAGTEMRGFRTPPDG